MELGGPLAGQVWGGFQEEAASGELFATLEVTRVGMMPRQREKWKVDRAGERSGASFAQRPEALPERLDTARLTNVTEGGWDPARRRGGPGAQPSGLLGRQLAGGDPHAPGLRLQSQAVCALRAWDSTPALGAGQPLQQVLLVPAPAPRLVSPARGCPSEGRHVTWGTWRGSEQ